MREVTTRQAAPPGPQKPSRSREGGALAPARSLAPTSAPTPTQALALQRMAGNRATSQILARWTAHPDSAKKGALVPDVVAAEYLRFNPPKNQ
ncbi:MAG TPA: hypothetical protein VGF91_15950 [Solirubrobacteraceae bacterium]|jgi:hypothetical protein